MTTLTQIAINQALNCLWEEAITTNLQILENIPSDINTLNRLGKAYAAIGDKEASKDTYQKVLKYDKYNSVALKNLKKTSSKLRVSPAQLNLSSFPTKRLFSHSVANNSYA